MLKTAKQHNLLNGEIAKKALSLSEVVGVLPYSLEMVEILADLDVDEETILAAILYPAVKTTDFDLIDCMEQYGEGPTKLIEHAVQMDGVRDLYAAVSHHGHQHHKVDVIRKMLLAMITDTRAVLIKLAEQVYLMRSAKKESDDVRLELAKETAAIYAPLANRLGIGAIKWELEDWSFRYLDGEKYRELSSAINQRRVDREYYIKDMVERLEELIAGLNISECKVYGRPKHIYSIYRKMLRKNVSFAEIYDSLALRVLVPTINDCYKALSAVHAAWQYIPQEFDDYIATPKANGYRSIHTAILGPDSRAVEIQIRTFKMHDEAELGAAAHWVYKEGGRQDSLLENKVAWLRQVAAWQQEVAGSDEVVEDVGRVFDERVYVFTPQNEVIDLPHGATPLDFAYHVHTSVGHRYKGAKVNGIIKALGYILKNGDKVEILTKKEERPSRDWLNEENGFVRTSRARAKIHHWFRQQEPQYVDEAIKPIVDKGPRTKTKNSVDHLGGHEEDVARHANKVSVFGDSSLLTFVASCCKPSPGDDIIGYVTKNRGIAIHRIDCVNLKRAKASRPEKVIALEWQALAEERRRENFVIEAFDRPNLLKDVAQMLSDAGADVLGLVCDVDKDRNISVIKLTAEIARNIAPDKMLADLAELPNVLRVKRS